MKNWRAVSIGIRKAGDMIELPGAVNGAKEFAAWATANGYQPTLFTDEKRPVEFAPIRAAISVIVNECPDRLLVYFAGHGLQRADGPLWLLSNWKEDEAETINVELSLRNASRSGIPAVGIFADSCRNVTGGAMSLTPRSIFPSRDQLKNPMVAQTQRDLFFACRFDEISQETKSANPSAAYGVFTKCLMSALNGKEPKAIEMEGSKAVTSQSLADFLEDAVARTSELLPGAEVQIPECVSGFRPPKNIYNPGPFPPASIRDIAVEIAAEKNPAPLETVLGALRGDLHYRLPNNGYIAGRRFRKPKISSKDLAKTLGETLPLLSDFLDESVANSREKAEARLNELTRTIDATKGRVSFETRQGFTIVGDVPAVAFISTSGQIPKNDIFSENNAFQVRAPQDDAPRSIAIRLQGGNWFAGALLPGFVGAVLVKDGAAGSLSYRPAKFGPYDQGIDEKYGAEVTRWTALMIQGRYASRKELAASAEALRLYKSVNPSMGILAAYAYERIGALDEISSIAGYFAANGQPVPFDVALLAKEEMRFGGDGKLEIETTRPAEMFGRGRRQTAKFGRGRRQTAPVAGSYPLLTRGWSFLDSEAVGVSPVLFELRKYLVPSLWTTLSTDGGAMLVELLTKGEL